MGFSSSGLFAQQPKPKNVILILADDMGWDIAALGHPHVKTPNLDRMVAEGRSFGSFYVAAPVCSPTRASFLTGQFPARFGITHFIGTPLQNRRRNLPDFLEPKSTTVADLAQQAGYRTGHFGKWHLDSGAVNIDTSEWGFDVFNPPGEPTELDVDAHSSEIIAARAVTFMEETGEQPFYINVWFRHMHRPIIPDAEQLSALEDETFPPTDFKPPMADYAAGAADAHERFLKYNSVVPSIDNAVGMILDYLDANNLSNDTLILFTSDNGPEDFRFNISNVPGMGNTDRFRGRKRSIYEGGIRMPCIARWLGSIPEGTSDPDSVVSSVDWLPTIASLIERPIPLVLDGEDKSLTLLGTPSSRTKPLLWEFSSRAYSDYFTAPQYAIRDGQWKFFWEEGIEEPELYDIVGDPEESTNLAGQFPTIVSELQQKIEIFDGERTRTPPVIGNSLPVQIVRIPGDGATLSVEATGTPPPYYQWYRDDVALTDSSKILGSTTSVLSIVDADLPESGNYYCIAQNSSGASTTNECNFHIEVSPEILDQPAPVNVDEGEEVRFEISIRASEPISYQWFLDGVLLEDGAEVSGSQTPILEIANSIAPISISDTEGYSCLVFNPLGFVNSSRVGLVVNEFAPVITSQPSPVFAFEGSDAKFSISAIASGAISYQWLLNGVPLEEGATYEGTQTPDLVVSGLPAPTIIASEQGFGCRVTNSLSSTTSNTAGLVMNSLANSSYESWAQLTMGMSAGAAAPLSDFDNDGVSNLLEYAYLTSPLARNTEFFFSMDHENHAQNPLDPIRIHYRRWVGGTQLNGGQYVVGDLDYQLKILEGENWMPISFPITQTTVNQEPNSSTEEVVIEISIDGLLPFALFRLEVTLD